VEVEEEGVGAEKQAEEEMEEASRGPDLKT